MGSSDGLDNDLFDGVVSEVVVQEGGALEEVLDAADVDPACLRGRERELGEVGEWVR